MSDTNMKLYVESIERHIDVTTSALRLASEGRWDALVEHLGDSLNNIDAVEPEDIPMFERAKQQAAIAEGNA